ncbi:BZ3500_MvSof-1268-A1-R1_Chr5-3g08294 [Microbotryum saponariae]|uniref:BZ3500_MvSof-1268-A1-R1_Chr5-3g08294 protein n=1 Tax=Microbotryum saponariae TaxID=289078 RepID=A0A2X0MIK4_9BASI|nr:BZ3500_MvSof-1268-A1-R1_Chr5-3g08294 [Microbotryum saponariae]SDA08402.1 BZ3501_MvSof-1269-A2-R1_Chr5-3g08022 [Microbotryum saponariae]
MIFEPDPDFEDAIAMAEVEEEEQQRPRASRTVVASGSSTWSWNETRVDASDGNELDRVRSEDATKGNGIGIGIGQQCLQMGVGARSSWGKGKATVFEEEDGFGAMDEDEVEAVGEFGLGRAAALPIASRTTSSTHDYTTPFSDLTNLNLSLSKPGYLETVPVSATTLDGKTVRFGRRKKLEMYQYTTQAKKEDAEALERLAHSMLETPYHRMVEQIQQEHILARKQFEADACVASRSRRDGVEDADVCWSVARGWYSTNAHLVKDDVGMNSPETTLWTDRYKPKRFTDLLGDEASPSRPRRIHRSALLWLKEWDQCVFKNHQGKNNAAAELRRERRKKRAREGGFGGAGAGKDGGVGEGGMVYSDPYGRPQEKVMLLCGPPGLGKTTLAYVLAQQAGYQVLEVNASDDRTGKVVEDRIRNALESTALTMDGRLKGNKPTCVIIDEVDGAGGGGESSFVRTLVKLVNEGSSNRKYRGKGKKDRPLLRPIICICNDLYAPTLRPLRPMAKIVRFSAPTNTMLVKRLRTICDEEGLGADSKNLTMLAEVAEGDLRSCLNTLQIGWLKSRGLLYPQFIKRRSTHVDEEAIRSTIVGLKDTGTSATQVINRLFKKPPRKKGGGNSDDRFVNRITRDVQTCGEYEKISQGCFENYLSAKQLTDTWPRINEALDWLFLYDRLDGRLRSDRDYELLGYVPYAFAPWYKLFSSHSTIPLEFPKADYEAYLKRIAHQEIVQTFSSQLPQGLKSLFTGPNVSAELLPLLNRILSPQLKPINSQLIKAEDRIVLINLVNTMLALGLAFVQDKNEEGQLMYKLEPLTALGATSRPIDVFVHFEGKRATDIAASRYAVRHLVTREMEAEVIRRSERHGAAAATKTTAGDILAAYNVKPNAANGAASGVKEAVDFFGRAIVAKPVAASEGPQVNFVVQPRAIKAVYRFHEGFSNAVRTTKRVADFLV